MNEQESNTEDRDSAIQRIGIVIRNTIDTITASLTALATVVGLIYLAIASVTDLPLPNIALSDTHIIFVVVFIAGTIFLYFPVVKGIKRLYRPPREWVQLVDGTTDEVIDLYYAHPDLVEDMKKLDGQIKTVKVHGEIVHIVNYFDPVNNEAKGPRRREVTDWDMVSDPEMIQRQRHRNSKLLERAKVISKFLPDIVQKIETGYFDTLKDVDIEDTAIEADDFISQLQNELPEVDEVENKTQVDDSDRDRSVLDEDKEGDNDE